MIISIFMAKSVPDPAEEYVKFREAAFSASWRKLGFAPTAKNPNVWGVIMEVGYPQTVVTLVCYINGLVNFYFGNGGEINGGGEHEAVRMKAEEFILGAETFLKKLNLTRHYPLPEINRVRFYALTFSGLYTTQANQTIDRDTHELFPLFRAGHEVIAALRAAKESAATKE